MKITPEMVSKMKRKRSVRKMIEAITEPNPFYYRLMKEEMPVTECRSDSDMQVCPKMESIVEFNNT